MRQLTFYIHSVQVDLDQRTCLNHQYNHLVHINAAYTCSISNMKIVFNAKFYELVLFEL